MAGITNKEILEALAKITEPETGKDIVSAGMIQGLQTKDGHVAFAIEVDPAKGAELEPMRKLAEEIVYDLKGVISATVVLTAERSANSAPSGPAPGEPGGPVPKMGTPELLPGVASIVAVASGKGGVGKSTTSVNIALGLAAAGRKVGLLDADIYGPSMPRMMGITGQPNSSDGKNLDALENFGIKVMSMGFLVEEDTPMIWRGPMVQSALEQMLRDVNWGELDALIIDMPPGTGDAQLTMAQKVPLTGAIIVSTPQDIALLDARRGLNMFRKVDVPVLGLIENMSYFICPNCGERSDIFSHGGAKSEAERLGMDFLGEIPLHIRIRETSDGGNPIVVSEPNSEQAQAYCSIANMVWEGIERTLGAQAQAAPKIVVE
ncbi:MAG: iron-sulfur cluster carrier protein ApbC [Pseudomonadota bacterium]|nr:iron-sulfur cluster carrier protein ApbC [Pseudomonadota bacterium]